MSKIGIDLGTTNVKAVLYNDDLKEVKKVSIRVQTKYDGEYAEQNIQEVYQACLSCLNQLVDESVTHVSFSSAMHSIILGHHPDHCYTNNVIWVDNRAKKVIDDFKEQYDWLSFYKKTGTPIHPMSPFAKLLWYKQSEHLLNEKTKIFGIKEYIIYQLTGQFVMDYSVASATGLMNIHSLQWDEDILHFLGITKNNLPLLCDVTTSFQATQYAFKVVVGASDGCLVNLGSRALNKGQTTLTIGTSGAVRMSVKKPILDPYGRTFCYYLKKNVYVIGGAVNNGGNVIEWISRLFYTHQDDFIKDLPNLINQTSPGAEGLVFLPHLFGERAPYWNANLSATFVGLQVYHTKAHLIRAVLEGILFNLKHVLEILEENGALSKELFISGAVLQNRDIVEMLVDIFNLKVHQPSDSETSCLGAILLSPSTHLDLRDDIIIKPQNPQSYYEAYNLFRISSLGLEKEIS